MLKCDESRACEPSFAILVLCRATRAKVTLCDTHPDAAARVEPTFTLGGPFYALEHTGIEPFADFMRLNNEAPRVIRRCGRLQFARY
jgi:hypothetical protein